MTLDTALRATPAFFSTNYFNRHADKGGDLSVSSGSTLRHRLYDMDPRARWISAGSTDAVTETIEAGLWVPGYRTLRSVDYIALMNHNIKEMTIQYSADNGGNWTTAYSAAAITDTLTRVSLAAAVDIDRVRLSLVKTQTANDEKRVGQVILAQLLFQPTMGMKVYTRHPPRMSPKGGEMADRSIRRAYVYRSDATRSLYGATLGFVGVGEDELGSFRDYFLHRDEPFIFVPEPGRRPSEAFLCEVTPNTYVDNYMQPGYPEAGSVVSFDVREVGGA